jgi:hypothetical protein
MLGKWTTRNSEIAARTTLFGNGIVRKIVAPDDIQQARKLAKDD